MHCFDNLLYLGMDEENCFDFISDAFIIVKGKIQREFNLHDVFFFFFYLLA